MGDTWNGSDKDAATTLSGGNLSVAYGAGGGGVRATTARSQNKWYWEIIVGTNPGTVGRVFGISKPGANRVPGNDVNGWGCYLLTGQSLTNGGLASYGTGPPSTSDVYGIAWDATAGKIWVAKNNTWFNSGNPATGVNPMFSGISGITAFPDVGNTGSAGSGDVANFGASAFSFTPPSGFVSYQTLLMNPAAGSYALTGVAVTINRAVHLVAATGSYVLTGIAATLHKNWSPLAAATGSYILTGIATLVPRKLAAATGSYALTGVSIAMAYLPGASQVKRGIAAVLQKLRVNPPTLDQ